MFRIVVTGGIASGKSTVADIFRELGAVIVDHDQIAHEILAPNTLGLAAVVATFGKQILHENQELDRAALAQVVFGDATARQKLNSLTHPLIEAAARKQEAAAVAANPDAVVVHDIPLFLGSWLESETDFSVLVTASEKIRISRMVTVRKMTEDDARARISAQNSDAELAKHVDYILENCGTPADLRQKAVQLWQTINSSHKQAIRKTK